MPAPKGTKAVVYFLEPTMIRDVKVEASATDRTQSEVVKEALRGYLRSRRSRQRPEATATA